MDAGHGRSAKSGSESTAEPHRPRPAGSFAGAVGIRNGAIRGRLCDPVSHGGRGSPSVRRRVGLGDRGPPVAVSATCFKPAGGCSKQNEPRLTRCPNFVSPARRSSAFHHLHHFLKFLKILTPKPVANLGSAAVRLQRFCHQELLDTSTSLDILASRLKSLDIGLGVLRCPMDSGYGDHLVVRFSSQFDRIFLLATVVSRGSFCFFGPLGITGVHDAHDARKRDGWWSGFGDKR